MGSDHVTWWQSSGLQQLTAPTSCLKSYPAPKQTVSDPRKTHITVGIRLITEIHCCTVLSSANEYVPAVPTLRQPRERAVKGTISLLPPSAEMSQGEPGVTPSYRASVCDAMLCQLCRKPVFVRRLASHPACKPTWVALRHWGRGGEPWVKVDEQARKDSSSCPAKRSPPRLPPRCRHCDSFRAQREGLEPNSSFALSSSPV